MRIHGWGNGHKLTLPKEMLPWANTRNICLLEASPKVIENWSKIEKIGFLTFYGNVVKNATWGYKSSFFDKIDPTIRFSAIENLYRHCSKNFVEKSRFRSFLVEKTCFWSTFFEFWDKWVSPFKSAWKVGPETCIIRMGGKIPMFSFGQHVFSLRTRCFCGSND